jgi:hypothetical protein
MGVPGVNQAKQLMNAARLAAAPSGNGSVLVHADDVAEKLSRQYSQVASEINGLKGSVNRIPSNLAPTAQEAAIAREAQTGRAIVEDAAQNIAGPSITDRVVGNVNMGLEIAGAAPLIVGGAQLAAKAVTKTGTFLTGFVSPSLAERVGAFVPERSWNSITFNEIGNATGLQKPVGNAVQAGANWISGPIQWLSDKTGLSSWRASANTSQAGKLFDSAKGMTLTAGDATVLSELQGKVMGASGIGDLAASTDVGGLITAAKEASKSTPLSEAGAQFLGSVEDSLAHQNKAATWNNVGEAVKGAPEKLGNTSATHGLMNAAFIGMSGMKMFGDARGFAGNLDSLRQMYSDVTGEDPQKVSTMKLLTGKLPEPVNEARNHLVAKFGIKQGFSIGNIAMNVAMMINPKWGSSWKAIGAMVGTSLASGAVDSFMGESILPVHKAFSEAHKSGRKIPAEFYAAYLYSASKELKTRGETGQQFAMAIGQQYAEEQIAPGALLQELSNGKLMERITALTQGVDAAQSTATQPTQEQQSFVSRQSAAGMQTERATLGKFTAKANQEAQLAGVAQGIA